MLLEDHGDSLITHGTELMNSHGTHGTLFFFSVNGCVLPRKKGKDKEGIFSSFYSLYCQLGRKEKCGIEYQINNSDFSKSLSKNQIRCPARSLFFSLWN